jgi:aerobic carbon-monoxide dehydrogenase medium subunit
MFPRPCEYVRPDSVAEALSALAEDDEAKPIAGGQSLVPMMSLGLATPTRVVDIGRLELGGLARQNGTVTVGALTTHRELERGGQARALLPLAAEAARHIGNARVRNRGTFGGSLSHADPSAELGAVVLVHGGHAVIEGPQGTRHVDFDEFFEGFFETAIGPGELLVAAALDPIPPGAGTAFAEVARRTDDFALAAAAAVVTLADSGELNGLRVALAGVADRPVRCDAVEQRYIGAQRSDELFEDIARTARHSIAPESDAFTSSAYRRRLAGVCVARAVETAWRRAFGTDGGQ